MHGQHRGERVWIVAPWGVVLMLEASRRSGLGAVLAALACLYGSAAHAQWSGSATGGYGRGLGATSLSQGNLTVGRNALREHAAQQSGTSQPAQPAAPRDATALTYTPDPQVSQKIRASMIELASATNPASRPEWEKTMADDTTVIAGVPITRHWLIPQASRPKVYTPHPVMSADEIRDRTQGVWDAFYSLSNVWARSNCVTSLKARLAFVLISKLYRQMYANTGIATDSARVNRSAQWARLIAKPCRRLFAGKPMPELTVPA